MEHVLKTFVSIKCLFNQHQTTFVSTTLAVRFFFHCRAEWKWEAWNPAGIAWKTDPEKSAKITRKMSAAPAMGHKMDVILHSSWQSRVLYMILHHCCEAFQGTTLQINSLNSRCPILALICFQVWFISISILFS